MKEINDIVAQARTPHELTSAMGQRAIHRKVKQKIDNLDLPIGNDGILQPSFIRGMDSGCPFTQERFDTYRHSFKSIVNELLYEEAVKKYIDLQILYLEETILTKLKSTKHQV